MKDVALAVVIAVAAFGLVVTTVFDHWRVGSAIIGLALCLGAVFRLSLPARQAGLLVVRSRTIDAAVLLTIGFALVALANTIPASR